MYRDLLGDIPRFARHLAVALIFACPLTVGLLAQAAAGAVTTMTPTGGQAGCIPSAGNPRVLQPFYSGGQLVIADEPGHAASLSFLAPVDSAVAEREEPLTQVWLASENESHDLSTSAPQTPGCEGDTIFKGPCWISEGALSPAPYAAVCQIPVQRGPAGPNISGAFASFSVTLGDEDDSFGAPGSLPAPSKGVLVDGGPGKDLIGKVRGKVLGGTGNDKILSSLEAYGEKGADLLSEDHKEEGGEGNDKLIGGKSEVGGAGNDILVAQNTEGSVLAGSFMEGGSGHDVFKGGKGNDFISARDGQFDRIKCGSGLDHVVADPRGPLTAPDQVASDCELVRRK
jgi:hypothetical protein